MKKKIEQNSKTHFEQVPLDVVKKIAKADESRDEEAGSVIIVQPVSKKSKPNTVLPRSRNGKRR